MLEHDREEYIVDGGRYVPLTFEQLSRVLDGSWQGPVPTYVGGQPCRYVGPAPEPAPLRQVSLVCEGRCNPDLRDTDRAVAREFAQYGALSDRSLSLLRALRHTPHEALPDGGYTCLRCRRIRRCGGA